MAKHLQQRSRVELTVAQAWQAFYATPEGRAAVAELMVWCNLYTDTGTTDPIQLAREAGERSVAQRVIRLLGLKPELAPQRAWEDADLLDRIISPRQ